MLPSGGSIAGVAVLVDVGCVDDGGRHLVVVERAAQGVGPRGVGVQFEAVAGGGAVGGGAGAVWRRGVGSGIVVATGGNGTKDKENRK
jgi:hypothetical protein